jgi:predicted metalloprotease
MVLLSDPFLCQRGDCPFMPVCGPGDMREILAYIASERDIAARFGLPAETVLPLLFSLRFGGAWSYATAEGRSISVVRKRTLWDERTKSGVTLEEITLLLNPTLLSGEGAVSRLEKCGNEAERLIVTRPYRVRVRVDRAVRVHVDPERKEIAAEEVAGQEFAYEGSTAFNVAHELEHLEKKGISGRRLWEMKVV